MKNTISFLLVVVASCTPFRATPPDGFAPFKGGSPFRAVSPDGIVYRVRNAANEPKADIGFWKEAMKKRMLDAGYHLLSDADIASANGTPGYLLELTAPVGQQDNAYLLALFAKDKDLVVAEASGEVALFQKRRAAITAAMAKIEF
jgi:hypothetical protein